MLTADLVDARAKDGELVLRPLDAAGRDEALTMARALLETAQALVGKRRGELDEAWNAVVEDVAPKRFKLAAGLRKLAADACEFDADPAIDPVELRRSLFLRASEARKADGVFSRDAVLADAATSLALPVDAIERALFADLRSEHILRAAPTADAASLVEAWELGQAQAVLLAAVRVTCEVSSASPGLVRAFFAKLKFHKLLFSAERVEKGKGWKVVIDGPYSMFDAVTKYGLRLALALPALRSLEGFSLVADIRWGKTRDPLVFRLASPPSTSGARRAPKLHLADDVKELLEAINAQDGEWRARATTALFDVPSAGVCIPDLELVRKGDTRPIYIEVLGYWSRDAVFRRVELTQSGLRERVIFAVSSRLRVSEEVLDESASSSLYVYKGRMNPRALLAHATRLAAG
jgi:uncharacterized protein